jgi:hypothetical protein
MLHLNFFFVIPQELDTSSTNYNQMSFFFKVTFCIFLTFFLFTTNKIVFLVCK